MAVGRSQLLAQLPGTHSRILSGIQRAAQAVLGVYLKRTCSRDTIHYHHRRHTTMSTVDSTPPEVSDGTRGIVS